MIRRILGRALTRAQIWQMKRLWRMSPHVQCKGLCSGACTNVPVTPIEALYIIQKHSAVLVPAAHVVTVMPTLGANSPCPMLKAGRCSIYDDRPLVCRQYGHKVATLDCGHDCVAKVPLTEQLMLDLWTSLVYLLDPLGIPPASFHGSVVFASLQEQIGNLEVEVETE